jgi:hypothetical protein
MDLAFAHKIAILLKKGWCKNCKIVKARCFLTILFASPLCFNKRKQAAVATG